MIYKDNDNWEDIKNGVNAICKKFPESYWQKLDQDRSYPSEFVKALTKAGFLGILIPEKYGGAGLPIRAASIILEEIHRSGANGAACHHKCILWGRY